MKIMDEATKHMEVLWKQRWTKKLIMQTAKKFKIYNKWREKYPGAPGAARRLGIYKEAKKHMIDGRYK